jgi:tetratricopeptide (TPR) repeat protein
MVTVLNSALFFDERAESYRRSGLEEEADACDEQAYAFYKKAMAAEPALPDAFFNAGFFYLKQHDFSRARECFETFLSLQLPEDEADGKDTASNISYKRERAREIITDISSRNLEDELFKSAFDFISMGQEEKGLEKIKEFIQKNSGVWNAWFMLGWALRRLERWSDAKAAFLQTIACGGKNTDTYNELSICYLELGEFDECRKCLTQALAMEPENTKIMSNLGFLALREGNATQARNFFLTVLEFDPDDAIAKKALADMNV